MGINIRRGSSGGGGGGGGGVATGILTPTFEIIDQGGYTEIKTPDATGDMTGEIDLFTGNATNEASGPLLVWTGSGDAESGIMDFSTGSAVNTGDIQFRTGIPTSGNNRGKIKTSGTLLLGTGMAATAPLQFQAGTNLTTPVNGTMEFDGSNLYITIAGVRRTITVT